MWSDVRRPLVLIATALALASLLGATRGGAAPVQAQTLTATVGPGFTIILQNPQGQRVTRVDPGSYEIVVNDRSAEHNFRLRGPGVDRATSVEGSGRETWTVTLAVGTYTFVCDPHEFSMRGTFSVGGASTPSGPAQNVVTPRTRLVVTSGPRQVITLRTGAGRPVRTMRRGTYTVVVRDRSRLHNARLVAPGFRRATTVPFAGQQRWRVRLARTGTLRFLCDPHASLGMRGTARIVR